MLFGYDRHLYRKYMISDSIHDSSLLKTAQEHEIFGDRDFPSWLTQQQISLACTTYQTSRLMLIAAVYLGILTADGGRCTRINADKG